MVLFGGCVVLFGGACMVLLGGMRGCSGGACMVLFGGHAWFYSGGHVCVLFGGACVVLLGGMRGFFSFFGYNEIRSMSGRYASYWNAFLFVIRLGELRKGDIGQIEQRSDWYCEPGLSSDFHSNAYR